MTPSTRPSQSSGLAQGAPGFEVLIVTPEDVFFKGRATSLIAPGALGYLGILRNHAPLLTPLVKGKITAKLEGDSEKKFETEGGFLEVQKNRVVILSEKIREGGE